MALRFALIAACMAGARAACSGKGQPALATQSGSIVMNSNEDVTVQLGCDGEQTISLKQVASDSAMSPGLEARMNAMEAKFASQLLVLQKDSAAKDKVIAAQNSTITGLLAGLQEKLDDNAEADKTTADRLSAAVAENTASTNLVDGSGFGSSDSTKAWVSAPKKVVRTQFRDGSFIQAVECKETSNRADKYCDATSNKFPVSASLGYEFGMWLSTLGQAGEMTHKFGFNVYDKSGKQIGATAYFHTATSTVGWERWSGVVQPTGTSAQVPATNGKDYTWPAAAAHAAFHFSATAGDGDAAGKSAFAFPKVALRSPTGAAASGAMATSTGGGSNLLQDADFVEATAGHASAWRADSPPGKPVAVASYLWLDGRPIRAVVQADKNKGACNGFARSKLIKVDPRLAYEFSVWMTTNGVATTMKNTFGVYMYDADKKKIGDGSFVKDATQVAVGKEWVWGQRDGILLPTGTKFKDGDATESNGADFVMSSKTAYVAMRFGSCGGSGNGKSSTYFAFPSVQEVGPASLNSQLGTEGSPGESCKAILAEDKKAPNGFYYLKVGDLAYRTYCDMTTDGGGWTAVIDPEKGLSPKIENAPEASWSRAQYYPANHANPGAGGNKKFPKKSFGVINQNAKDRGGKGITKGRFKASWPAFTQIRVKSAGGEVCMRNHHGNVNEFHWGTCGQLSYGNKRLNNKGGTAYNLGECEGDCDRDSDCSGGGVCFQRSRNEKIPGCANGGVPTNYDFCYKPEGPAANWAQMSCKDLRGGCCNHRYHGSTNGKSGGYSSYSSWGMAILPQHAKQTMKCKAETGFVEFGAECGAYSCSSSGFAKWESFYVR